MTQARPGLPQFDYLRPDSLEDASRFLAEHPGQARPFLGGTDTFVRLRDGVWHDNFLVDVKHLPGMDRIAFDPARGLELGAAVNMNQVIAAPVVAEHYPLLVEAARTVASYPLRSRATLVGNLCNASPAGDTTGACLVFQAVVHVSGVAGARQIPLASFFEGPGKTTLKPGDIATGLAFPVPPRGAVGRYLKLGRNAIGDLAIVGVTVLGFPDAGSKSGYAFRLALASVAPIPLIPHKAEQILCEARPTDATIGQAAEAAMAACQPIDDVRGSAEYRRLMVRNLTRKAVGEVWARLQKAA
jgi:carbon-monoxide dehydrogenase medium subunit